MTARWPAPSQLPPAKPSPGKRTWGGRAKGRVTARGLSPAPSSARASPRWPRTSTPHPNRLSLQETLHHRICFLGQSAPSAPPAAPRRGCHDPALDAVRQRPGPGGGGGGREAQPAHKGPFVELPVACGPARTHRVGARDLEILVRRGVEGPQPGPPLLWLGAGLTQPMAGESRLAHGPLQFSPGPSPPHRDERRPD